MPPASDWTIYYDDLQEGAWFQDLSPHFADAALRPLSDALRVAHLADTLRYDRPDILLTHRGVPVLVVERTIEVPSGHNVGQRFARLAAAAEQQVPLVYFGPFKARKHGGETEGPRFMNLRLFYALDKIESINGAAVSTVNWPVDDDCELIRLHSKDDQMREYVEALIDIIVDENDHQAAIVDRIRDTAIYERLKADRLAFEQDGVRNPEQYEVPPPSVRLLSGQTAATEFSVPALRGMSLVVAYKVGMNYVRSDPYTGMGMLYRYLYVLPQQDRCLVLQFPGISLETWETVANSGRARKDVKLYRLIADGVQFSDTYRARGDF